MKKRIIGLLFLSSLALAPVSCEKEKGEDTPETIVLDGAVDMGIVMTRPDGTTYKLFWAECNLGASVPEEFGDYYAWGEIEPMTRYDIDSYKYANGSDKMQTGPSSYVLYLLLTRYCPANLPEYWGGDGAPDGKTEFGDYAYADDAARARLGGKWRMPTEAEWMAMRRNSIMTVETVNNVRCFKLASKITGNKIYLPAAGSFHSSPGREGYYWTATVDKEYPSTARAWSKTQSGTVYMDGSMTSLQRWGGFSVRAVYEE